MDIGNGERNFPRFTEEWKYQRLKDSLEALYGYEQFHYEHIDIISITLSQKYQNVSEMFYLDDPGNLNFLDIIEDEPNRFAFDPDEIEWVSYTFEGSKITFFTKEYDLEGCTFLLRQRYSEHIRKKLPFPTGVFTASIDGPDGGLWSEFSLREGKGYLAMSEDKKPFPQKDEEGEWIIPIPGQFTKGAN